MEHIGKHKQYEIDFSTEDKAKDIKPHFGISIVEELRKANEKKILPIDIQLKNYQLREDALQFYNAKLQPFKDFKDAQIYQNNFNKAYGYGTAEIENIKDPVTGKILYHLHIAVPTKEDYKDVIDSNGKLLPEFTN